MKKRSLIAAVLGAAAAAFSQPALSQQFPSKPLRIVISFPPGGSVDFLARAVGEKMAEGLGQPVLVENRPGANSIIAAETVARAPADGYSLFMPLDTTLTQNPSLLAKLPYDPVRDFAPISQITAGYMILVTHPNSGFRTLAELVAYAKANPGKLNIAVTGVNNQLVAYQLRTITGVDIVNVPYKGTVPMLQALLAGDVHLVADGASAYMPNVKQGKLVVMASTAPTRYLPDVATVRELGYPLLESTSWIGLFAPGGTPQPIVSRLNALVVKALASPDLRDRLIASGLVPVSSTPEQLGAMLREDIAKWAPIIKAAGLKLE
jgi:tripartite-type tricarboxylate transporter receptor subunit TctC